MVPPPPPTSPTPPPSPPSQPTPPHTPNSAPSSESTENAAVELAIESARLAADSHCENVVVLDVRELSQVTQFIVIGTGTSDRQMYSVAEDIGVTGSDAGHPVFRSSQERASSWMVIDFFDVIVHLFEPNTRAYYDLESLWIDAERIKWRRPAGDAKPTDKITK